MVIKSYEKAAMLLRSKKVGVVPSDTLYGFSCSAFCKECVERIYRIKNRDFDKPFIILIPDIESLSEFGVDIEVNREILEKYWPGPVSIILDCKSEKFSYLHRGMRTLAFRVPSDQQLQNLLKETGPIVSTSLNVSGEYPVEDIKTANELFDEKVDFYLDVGTKTGSPSKIIKMEGGKEVVIR